MRLTVLLCATLAAGGPLAAAGGQTPPETSIFSPKKAAAADQLTERPVPKPGDSTDGELPVSFERIREGLARPVPSLLRGLDIKPDFIVYIQEREHVQAILSTLDFKLKGVVGPPGGLYAYEQQRIVGSKTSNPLGQPYAAFSGGELITLAVQGLMQRYLGGKIVNAVGAAARSLAERAAEHEVARAVAEYCASRPDGGQSLRICGIEAMRAMKR
jgi:hypothetical protein